MKLYIYLTLLSFITAESNQFPPTRIVGGYEVQPKFKYPWFSSLQFHGKHHCGGTLINSNTIISAAHCVNNADSLWKALIHRHDLSLPSNSENGKIYNITKRIKHPKYNKDNNAYDISIWKINAPTDPTTQVKLDDGKYSYADNTLLKVIGWGVTTGGGIQSKVLLEVEVPVYNIDHCHKTYFTMDIKSQMCAGYPEGGKDSCQGDSGGPLFIQNGRDTILVGVVSWGSGCAEKGFPGIYTRVGNARDFINSNLD